ncbi:MAG TPA: ThiF family adenylyltransferase [Gemmatales bacterium]|nr:ThiF family adenylyltransferase [Gemmatales bacterium]
MERYSRQMRFHGVGEAGQKKLLETRVTLCGCGALGTVLANVLVRAGFGFVRIIDRDFIETHNLQRQVLFDEDDVAAGIPKAEAAARKLCRINSEISIESIVTDIDHTNILDFVRDVDIVLDGTDNFEVRYLVNDAAIQLNKPWVYGGAIGLRCVVETSPPPGMAATCETAGVLSPTINVIASLQATEAIKIATGHLEAINRELVYIDVWDNEFRRFKISKLKDKVDCPCCKQRNFEWLEGKMGAHTTSLCGRNAVQVAHRTASQLNFETLAEVLQPAAQGTVNYNKFMLRFSADGHEFTVFPDGRAIIKGTSDIDRAKTLYAKFIGH